MFYEIFVELCRRKAVYWKRGSVPKGDTLEKLADYFGVSVDYLLGKEKVRQINFDITPDPEWMELERKMEDGTITPDEAQRYKELMSKSMESIRRTIPTAKQRLLNLVETMSDGELRLVSALVNQIIAERPETAPKSTPPPSEGKDTTPPPDAPETAPEGE